MVSRVARVLQDRTNIVASSSSGASVGWKSGISMTPKKGGRVGGRTPLGDLSNSLKPSAYPGEPSKFSFVENENPAVARKKKGQVGVRRRALSDISNSGKPPVNEKRKDSNTKLCVVTEEPDGLDISREGFLHNHDECVKANPGAMDMNQFLKTLGLRHGLSNKLEIPHADLGGAKMQALDVPLLPEEPEEIHMETLYWKESNTSSYNLASPAGSPLSPKHCFNFDDPNFELIESPKPPLLFPVMHKCSLNCWEL